MFLVIPAWLLAMLPQLLGGVINAFTSQGAVNRMNRYNAPGPQLMRLNAAGLPFAAFTAGQSGQQSSLPDFSGIGESVGSLGNYFVTQLQKIQTDIAKQGLRKAKAEADIAEQERDAAFEPYVPHQRDYDASSKTFGFLGQLQDFYSKDNAMKLQSLEGKIKQLDLDLKIELKKDGTLSKAAHAELDKLLLGLKIGGQAYDNERVRNIAKNEILRRFEKGGLSLFEAILIQVMSSLGGSISSPFGKLGF